MTSTKDLQLFMWHAWVPESSNSAHLGMIASTKEEAIKLILESLEQYKLTVEFKEKVKSPLTLSTLLPNAVLCEGPWCGNMSYSLTDGLMDSSHKEFTVQEFLTKKVPAVFPVKSGLAFFASALQG
jgi:hypothetical protein